MRHRWKWISTLIIAAVLGLGWRPSPPAPGSITATPEPAPTPSAPIWPAGTLRAADGAARKGDQFDEIEVCGVGKVKLDRDEAAAAGKHLNALTRNSRLRWLAALHNSDDDRARAAGLYL